MKSPLVFTSCNQTPAQHQLNTSSPLLPKPSRESLAWKSPKFRFAFHFGVDSRNLRQHRQNYCNQEGSISETSQIWLIEESRRRKKARVWIWELNCLPALLGLDHELKECLVARAEAKAKNAREEETKGRVDGTSGGIADSGRTITSATANQHKSLPEKDQRNSAAFQFSAAYNGEENIRRNDREQRDRLPATLRLGPSVPLQANNQSFVNRDREEPAANDPIPARIPAAQRITLPSEPQGEKDGADEAKSAKKKRGRPPGKRTISGSPKLMQGEVQGEGRWRRTNHLQTAVGFIKLTSWPLLAIVP
ncbi:hypothetical protein F2Q69_00056800 [Brassica cretica]|uniref:Uncharacterized protein n=1 Tax=Brassica cretica TaxID=69181 RepID=A0A8S9MWU9_BRACR|nr:hypothetical protein F2Q69_00056800 [Brassica cretica]